MHATDQAAQATTHSTPVAEASGPGRLLALDVFRGLTVLLMLLVNFPGWTGHYYAALSHREWDGCSPADLVFPFFLFIVGVSLAYGLAGARREPARQRRVLLTVLRRTAILLALGMFIDLVPRFYFTSFRIPGVLQRIGLVFLACSLLYLKTSWRTQLKVLVGLLVGYCLLLLLVPVPGVGAPSLERLTNLGTWLDRLIFTQRHLYSEFYSYDPEGLLTTLPAVGTGLLGVLSGQWLRQPRPAAERVAWLLLASAALIVLGLIWNGWFPINKQLWTSSYVLYSGGLAGATLGMLYWLCDVQGWRRWAAPLLPFGVNAITIYFLSELVDRLLTETDRTLADGSKQPLRQWLYDQFFLPYLGPTSFGGLVYAVLFTAIWALLAWLMYRRRIIIKI
jgi:predicted acyltransferase